MVSKRLQSETRRPPSIGWAFASLLALLGVALASEYLFPSGQGRSAESQLHPRNAAQAAEANRRGRHERPLQRSQLLDGRISCWASIRTYRSIGSYRLRRA
jgi:hypothetical protein